jgi:gamma-glutamyltranspeptidase/glutathione hydrolase
VGYALAVVYPAAGNLGGGGFMTIQLADGRKTFLDFREKAPLAATANMYLDKDGNVVPDLSTAGTWLLAFPAPCPAWKWRCRNTAPNRARK